MGVAAVEVGLTVADEGAGAAEDAGVEVAGLEATGEEAGAVVVDGVDVPQAVSRKEMTKTTTRGISNFFTDSSLIILRN